MSDLRALDRCPVCGTPGSLVSSDEGTSHFRPAVPATDEPKPCARYWGSDGTLCSTHNGRFVDDGTTGGVMKCDRALVASSTDEPMRAALTAIRDLTLDVPAAHGDPESYYLGQLRTAIGTAARALAASATDEGAD